LMPLTSRIILLSRLYTLFAMPYPQFIKDETHDVNKLGRKAREAALYPAV
jgi:hypothetical protein